MASGPAIREKPSGLMKSTGCLFLLLCCLAAGSALAGAPNAVVFMYHHFGEDKHPSTNIRLEQFEAHLGYLQTAGYQILPLEEIARAARNGAPLPERAVAITIDDAYVSVYTQAYPRLKRLGWPFTVFVATDSVDRKLPAFMTWEQMREMQAHGATFANHSASHDYLIRAQQGETRRQWRARVRRDILRAQERLREELSIRTRLFAYPYGEYNRALADIVAELGLTAFGQHSGAIGPYADPLALPRFPMAEKFASLDQFRLKAASLAMPVIEVTPWDPQRNDNTPPAMTATLAPSDADLKRLRCFASDGSVMTPVWLDGERRRFMVTAAQPLPAGRSRYNCTAPSSARGRFYWFSHLWIAPDPRR